MRKTALQRRRGAIAKPKLNMGQQQLPRKNNAAKNLRRSGAMAKPKVITDQPQLSRKPTLQRICGAAAQSRNPRSCKGKLTKGVTHEKHVQQRNMCTIRRPTPKEAQTDKLLLLRKCVYGLADEPCCWYVRVREDLSQLDCNASKLDNDLFFWIKDGCLQVHVV